VKITNAKDTVDWYNKNAHKYKEASDKAFSKNDLDQLNEFGKLIAPKSKVLDVGCGSGRDSNLMTQKGFNLTGLDISSGLINLAKKSYPNIKFVLGDMTQLPFSNEKFDGIWSHASLLHLETVEAVKKALSEFYRVLRPKGILHVLVKAQTTSQKTAIVKDKLSKHDRFFQFFKLDELKKLLEMSGFTIIHIEQYNETKNNPDGRQEVDWIVSLSSKG